jgi:YVTN family beta-propeller protein
VVVAGGALMLAAPGTAQARTALVVDYGASSVLPIDLETNAVGAPIPMGDQPHGIAIAPDGATAYVTNNASDTVTAIDVVAGTVSATIAVASGPWEVAITPDGARAYVTNANANTVTVIEVATNTVVATITGTGVGPMGIAIAPDGATAYVGTGGANSVTPIDLATNTAGIPIPAGYGPRTITITPDGATAYAANPGGSSVTPIDLATGTAGSPIAMGFVPTGIAITPDGATAYVSERESHTVTPIDVATNIPGAPIAVDRMPSGIAITPDGATAYTTSPDSGSLTPIDVATNTAGSPIAAAVRAQAIAIVPNREPAAAFGASAAPAGSVTSLDAGASTDLDGTVARHDWDFGDGAVLGGGGATPSHTYAHAGIYTVTLTVTDDEGCSTAFVFTGQTASCTGSSAARTTRQVTVAKAAPTVAASASGDAVLGGSVRAGATLAGGHGPSGQLTFRLHGPGDATCAGAPVFTDTVMAVAGNGSFQSSAFTPTVAGDYRWTASYSGDADNAAAASGCDATATVSATPSPPRLLVDAPGLVIASRSFAATCRASAATLRSCRVEVRRRAAGGTRSRPLAVGRATSAAGARRLTVRLRLTRDGRRALAGSLGGVRVSLSAQAGSLRAQRSLRLLGRTHHVEPAGAMFGPNRATLTGAGRRFLARVHARARHVGSVRCTGHSAAIPDGNGGAALSLARARVACRHLRRLGLGTRYRTTGVGDRDPRASNDSESGRARNRYVDLTITHHR